MPHDMPMSLPTLATAFGAKLSTHTPIHHSKLMVDGAYPIASITSKVIVAAFLFLFYSYCMHSN